MAGARVPLDSPLPPAAVEVAPCARFREVLWGGPRAAFALLSRVRIGAHPLSPAARRWAPAFFPLVGLSLGAGAGAVHWLAQPLLGGWVAACLAIGTLLVATGALHEDGLADTADALGAGASPERIFAVLKDSRIGTYGALALGLSLLLRVGLLVRLGPLAPLAIVAAAVLSRTTPVALLGALPYVTPAATAKNRQVRDTGWRQVALGAGLCAAILGLLAWLGPAGGAGIGPGAATGWLGSVPPLALAAAAGAAGLAALVCGRHFRRQLGGVTGDFLGASQQVSEIAVLLVLAGAGPILS